MAIKLFASDDQNFKNMGQFNRFNSGNQQPLNFWKQSYMHFCDQIWPNYDTKKQPIMIQLDLMQQNN